MYNLKVDINLTSALALKAWPSVAETVADAVVFTTPVTTHKALLFLFASSDTNSWYMFKRLKYHH